MNVIRKTIATERSKVAVNDCLMSLCSTCVTPQLTHGSNSKSISQLLLTISQSLFAVVRLGRLIYFQTLLPVL